MNKRSVFSAAVIVLSLAAASARGEEIDRRLAGVGYKIGNGIGLLGADVIVRAVPHVSFDLQANYFQAGTASGTAQGYGFAPTAQLELREVGHTPYLGLGYVYGHMSLRNVDASVHGVVVNLGYQWRFGNGVGVLVGGGLGYLGDARATDGVTILEKEGGAHLNIEAGVRYFF
jgi:hypothetical protein